MNLASTTLIRFFFMFEMPVWVLYCDTDPRLTICLFYTGLSVVTTEVVVFI